MRSKSKLGPNFSKLWAAYAISALGDGALYAAGPLLVASITSSPLLIASAVFAQTAPWLLFSFISGVYIDRLDKRRAFAIANTLRTVAIGGLAIVIAAHMVNVPLVYLALFLLGIGDVLADGAGVTLMPRIVAQNLISTANSRVSVLNNITRQFIGPPLGAFLFVGAAALPFGLDALTFVVAAILITSITLPKIESHETASHERKHFVAEMKDGFKHLNQLPLLKTLMYTNFLANVTSTAIAATLVIYVKHQLHLGSVGYGVFLSTAAIGGILGGAITPRLHARLSKPNLLTGILVAEASFNLVFVFLHNVWIAGILYGLWSAFGTVWFLTILSLRQQTVAPQILGRVNGIYNFYRMGGIAVGALVGGSVVSHFGVTAPYWIGAVIVGSIALFTRKQFAAAQSNHSANN